MTNAIALTLARNPELQAGGYTLRAADAFIDRAGLSPPLVVGGELENFAGTGNVSGARGAETTLRLSRVIEMGGKLGARVLVADEAHALAAVEQQALRLDVLAQVTRRFVHVVSDQEQLALARRATELAERTLDLTAERVAVGRSPVTEQNRAQIALARARIAEEHAEHELLSSRLDLSVLWGETEPAYAPAAGALYALPAMPEFPKLIANIEKNPDLASFVNVRRLNEARLRLAETQRQPDLSLTGGVRRLEQFDDQAFVFSLSVPLGMSEQAAPEIAAASADYARVEFDARAKRLELRALLFGIYQELLHARTEAQTLREDVLPLAQENLRQTEEGFRVGRYSFLELTVAQAELLDIEREAIQAARDYHDYVIEIERLTGGAVTQ
ncbi:MAG: TolC family protein [Gammaproteobacteria bacterium]